METLAAIVVLSIGLIGMAVLMSNMMTGGARSRYMSVAAMLASEKLEDLERYPAADPNVAVTSGVIAGSPNSDITASMTSNSSTDSVDYFDTIQLSATGGNISETSSGKDASGNTNFTIITHAPTLRRWCDRAAASLPLDLFVVVGYAENRQQNCECC